MKFEYNPEKQQYELKVEVAFNFEQLAEKIREVENERAPQKIEIWFEASCPNYPIAYAQASIYGALYYRINGKLGRFCPGITWPELIIPGRRSGKIKLGEVYKREIEKFLTHDDKKIRDTAKQILNRIKTPDYVYEQEGEKFEFFKSLAEIRKWTQKNYQLQIESAKGANSWGGRHGIGDQLFTARTAFDYKKKSKQEIQQEVKQLVTLYNEAASCLTNASILEIDQSLLKKPSWVNIKETSSSYYHLTVWKRPDDKYTVNLGYNYYCSEHRPVFDDFLCGGVTLSSIEDVKLYLKFVNRILVLLDELYPTQEEKIIPPFYIIVFADNNKISQLNVQIEREKHYRARQNPLYKQVFNLRQFKEEEFEQLEKFAKHLKEQK